MKLVFAIALLTAGLNWGCGNPKLGPSTTTVCVGFTASFCDESYAANWTPPAAPADADYTNVIWYYMPRPKGNP